MQPCVQVVKRYVLYTNTHPFNGPFSGLPGWADTRKVNPIWILLKQETVSGNGISWAICKSAPRSRQTTTPVPHHSVFTGRIPFLPPNQQRQSTEGIMYCIQRTRKLWTRNEFFDSYWTQSKKRVCGATAPQFGIFVFEVSRHSRRAFTKFENFSDNLAALPLPTPQLQHIGHTQISAVTQMDLCNGLPHFNHAVNRSKCSLQ